MTHKRAFTIVELLITFLLIGILASIAIFALSHTRAKSRDAKRVSDVQVIRAALEQHWLTMASYPSAAVQTDLGTGTAKNITSLGLEGEPPSGTRYVFVPTGPVAGEYYQYQSTLSYGYALRFVTETTTIYGPAGTYYAHSGTLVDMDSSSK
jgi:prepilin-type N-terminal cleavage/methylation domain-containing protein